MERTSIDESFRRSLAETIASNRLPEDICRAVGTDNTTRGMKSERIRRFIYTFNRTALAYLCDFNLFNPFCEVQFNCGSARLTWRQRLDRLIHNHAGRGTSKRWPKCLLIIFIFIAISNFIKIYYQYIYDFNKFKLLKLHALPKDTTERDFLLDGIRLNVDELHSTFSQRARRAHQLLKLLGSSHTEWSFLSQTILLIFLPTAINAYVIFPACYIMSDMAIMLPTAIANDERCWNMRMQLILHELDKFSFDCLAYSRTKLEQMYREFASTFRAFETTTMGHQIKNYHFKVLSLSAIRLRRHHRQNIQHLRALALNGSLNPLNVTPACQDKQARNCFTCVVFLSVYVHSVLALGYEVSKSQYNNRGILIEHDGFRDIIDTVRIFLAIETVVFSASLLMVVFATLMYDQIEKVTKLRLLIVHVVRKNQFIFDQLTRATPASSDHSGGSDTRHNPMVEFGKRLELDLMTVIMQYRIVSKSLLLAQRPLNLLALMLILFALATPTILRIHSAYFEKNLRLTSFLVGIACSLLSYLFIWPLGLLHKRSIKALDEVWSLVAQISFYASIPDIKRYLDIGSSVAVFTLRRELADSQQTAGRFACRVLSVPITYNSLIKISFLTLLVLLSLSNNVNFFGDKFVQIMNDPFGLYSFLRPTKRE